MALGGRVRVVSAPRSALDEDLTRLADGDRAAFDRVFAAAWPQVLDLCRRLAPSPADAEDAAQATMTLVFTRIDEYETERPALPWILGIAGWQCRALRTSRSRRREEALEEAPLAADARRSPHEETESHELVVAAQAALGQLSALDRETLTMFLVDAPDAAGPTFRKRKERALTRLRSWWERLHGPV
jgi:RNA polymerase sigma-70 factor (ECF subfamily)